MAESPAPARLSLAGRPELRRYSRHLLIPEVGLAGQERLAAARVLVVGAGFGGLTAAKALMKVISVPLAVETAVRSAITAAIAIVNTPALK